MPRGTAAAARPLEQLRARLGRPLDRLGVALFVAAMAHAALILGLRFSAPKDAREPLPTLEVLLVPDGPPAADVNEDAAYIAQRAQAGSGTTRAALRASLPESSASVLEQAGDPQGDAPLPLETERSRGSEPLVARHAQRASIVLLPGEGAQAIHHTAPLASQPMPRIGTNAQAADETLRLRGDAAADARLLANTRASQIASYLDTWKRRVERTGTQNFPPAARSGRPQRNPVLEVLIRADGELQSVAVLRSSGRPELDRAALQIVRRSAPFERFPPAVRATYPELRFAYEWQFLDADPINGASLSETAAEPGL